MLSLSIAQCATWACLLEVSAPKVGNVHRGADFDDLVLDDFLASAVAIGPAMERAATRGVGATVFQAVEATRRLVETNSNLGTILLLAPLAAVPESTPLRRGIGRVLGQLGPRDAELVYRAIRLANPGGLGTVKAMDVQAAPPTDLLAAMRYAASYDLVARQYAEGFELVLDRLVPWLLESAHLGPPSAIVHTQVRLLAAHPDSLIARKCGAATAQESSDRAAAVLAAGPPESSDYLRALTDFDFWLRSDGHRRNPGTTADLIAAALFVLLRDHDYPAWYRTARGTSRTTTAWPGSGIPPASGVPAPPPDPTQL